MKKILLAAAAAATVSGTAHASLIGDSVLMEWVYPDAASVIFSKTVTVGAGAEVTCNNDPSFCSFGGYGNDAVFFDLSAADINMSFTNGSTGFVATDYNGFRFSDLDMGGPITGVTLTTNINGLDMSRVTFGPDWVSVNLASLATSESFWNISLQTVPAPTSLALLGVGLLALGMRRRTRLATA